MNETRQAVLESLEVGPITGPDIAAEIGISRAAVWKHVEALREAGFEIDGTGSGYVLGDVSGYTGPLIEYGLSAPFSIEYHDTLSSTNERARELATAGAEDVVVVAGVQTGGRGRLDRKWSSPEGGIWLSTVERPSIPPARAPAHTIAAAVATTNVAREVGVDARIKWPNDVVVPADTDVGYAKLAGILTEMEGQTDRIEWLVCGIGINANVDPSSLPEGATSIRANAGAIDRRTFLQRVLERYDDARRDLSGTIEEWRDRTMTLDRRVRVIRSGEPVVGTAVDVTEYGGLVVDTGTDRVVISAGDCEHLRPA
ncbi:biotin--[acetyl-CoA-carboxylase] ligase [Halovivax gelatinilyticus]|uniref:biotin--[acetyl-CoA-carboxylase] ligase n=1 Tax=Halovivax gelatinilyticus TaxID=2961597 RepID=UPI0020CA63C8|nr:biotin--[acetyl-CoA-carboxylase] ligase [Halovivax gelatinilyticus]